MNRAELDAFLAERGFKVDEEHNPSGIERNKFRKLYIGTGRDRVALAKLRDELRTALKMGPDFVKVEGVNVEGHPDFGKLYILIDSFWNE